MLTGVIFEHRHRGNVWRLEVSEHDGRTFANFRRWFENDHGELCPTKDGCTFPLERLLDLSVAVSTWATTNGFDIQIDTVPPAG
ncbi:PC4/YdbC family ssDNA-binding protein [Parasphingopyxis lamellibrachiae]|uniref:Transcriptional coactivator p15 (PC4) n=1 Tax=Parasphingopyxis lamellibrachiae TaxID=680125 RepID=A0A3D9FI87_9SPHN|nr:PC4/YdbC family ssDNA-binding protein [Parasphingopyxis lamellibrachiae]RED17495.1 transcriptional coactivator p15 (PC4) [Parasphingopyxis lamellibrachiae]